MGRAKLVWGYGILVTVFSGALFSIPSKVGWALHIITNTVPLHLHLFFFLSFFSSPPPPPVGRQCARVLDAAMLFPSPAEYSSRPVVVSGAHFSLLPPFLLPSVTCPRHNHPSEQPGAPRLTRLNGRFMKMLGSNWLYFTAGDQCRHQLRLQAARGSPSSLL